MTRRETRDVDQARLASYVLFASDDLTVAVQIHSCRECASWHLEAEPRGDGHVVVREWHDADCPHLASLVDDDLADAD